MRNAYKSLFGKPGGRRLLGRPRHGWEDNIKIDVKETACEVVDWILMAQDRDQ
jgi:hypothetical protein